MHSESYAPIAVLGTGSWGTALAILLAKNKQNVRLWGHNPQQIEELLNDRCNKTYLPEVNFPDNLQLFDDLEAALDGVQDILIVVPSHGFREVVLRIANFGLNRFRLAWGTKGLDPTTGELLHTVVEEVLGHHPVAVLAGPSFAREVALGLPTLITAASNDHEFSKSLAQRLQNQTFRVYPADDVIGAEVCGILKNILAIAAGSIDGLHLGANALSAMITRGLAEMQRLGLALGGKPGTFVGLAGMGDLVLTCTDNQSRNRRFGRAIALGRTKDQALQEIGQVVEGLFNLKPVYEMAKNLSVDMPITEQIYQVIYENMPVEEAIRNLFGREIKPEVY